MLCAVVRKRTLSVRYWPSSQQKTVNSKVPLKLSVSFFILPGLLPEHGDNAQVNIEVKNNDVMK